ncbi:MAG TPA: cupin domain-containing protein [Candidatus Dormibacteraeota bacterium]
MRRVLRWAVLTTGLVGLFVAVSAVPGAATPPVGFTSEILGRGTYMSHGTLPLTQGLDVVVSRITVVPGGSSGWHSHPGGAIAILQQGQLTLYESVGNHCDVTTYTAGQTFVERPGDVVNAVNTGSTDFVVIATFPGVPVGGSTRIDQPNPGTCPGI